MAKKTDAPKKETAKPKAKAAPKKTVVKPKAKAAPKKTVVKPKAKAAPKKETAKPKAKKAVVKKVIRPEDKKAIKIQPPKDLVTKKIEVKLPEFKNVADMKKFCVSTGLNKVDGYIPVTKEKKAVFLKWMEDNKDKTKEVSTSDNPHSPSSGIGELANNDNINAAKNDLSGIGTKQEVKSTPIAPEVVKPDLPPLSTSSDNTNEPPTAITENIKSMEEARSGNVNVENVNSNVKQEMANYADSILSHINESFHVKFHGGLPRAELNILISKCSKLYTYEVVNDDEGVFIGMTDGEDESVRIPKKGFLPIV